MKFYTNFVRIGNFIHVRGYNNGKRFVEKIDYNPTLYLPSQKPTKYRTLDGAYVAPVHQGTMRDAGDFIRQYEDVSNFKFYGSTNYAYVCINETYQGRIDYDQSLIRIANIDIEVGSENGFPEPASASEPITAITVEINKHFNVFGCGEYNNSRDDVTYTQCRDENHLIETFLHFWRMSDPDVITGWNIKYFDIPYLYNRIHRLFDEKVANRLSPLGMTEQREINGDGVVDLHGLASLDYLELYKKFTYTQQESYRLDQIAFVELGERKLDYSEYENLHELYRLNYQKFIEYNIRDVEIVSRIEDKMKLIEMAFALAYDAKVNYPDVFTQVRMWDCLTHNYLMDKSIVVPQKTNQSKNEQYAGAYVKDPIVGMHEWVVSFDLNSLYPHLMMQYNISPETIVEGKHIQISVDDFLEGYHEPEREHCLAANGHYFRKDVRGFLPEMMERMYADRVLYKRKMLEAQQEYEKTKNKELLKDISKYKNIQMAKKIQLNSAYGAIGNQYFRFYDIRQAEAITLSGQLSIRWIGKRLNEYMNKILKTEHIDYVNASKTEHIDYVIASDTDSVYLNFGPLIKKVCVDKSKEEIVNFLDKACGKIENFIDKSYDDLARMMNAYEQKMEMKREVIADKGIWTAKKRYILNVWDSEGVRYAEPKLKIMGIEAVKSSTPMACREKIKTAMKIVMTGTQAEFQKFIAEFKEEFKQLAFEDIAFPRSVSDLNKYKSSIGIYAKGTPIHVRGAILFNHLIEKNKLQKKYQMIRDGDKIKFCYMKVPNPIQENIFSILNVLPKELKLEKYVDYETQFEKAYLDPLRTIVQTIGWTTEQRSSLESFFT
jgi:DNA polymerase elongation subunit (family B)